MCENRRNNYLITLFYLAIFLRNFCKLEKGEKIIINYLHYITYVNSTKYKFIAPKKIIYLERQN